MEETEGYLLDTNVILILFKPKDPRYPALLTNFQAIQNGPVFLPVIAIAEIEFGIAGYTGKSEEETKAVRNFFARYPHHLPVDDNTVEPYALLRAQLWRDYGTRKARGGYKEKLPEELVERVSGKSLGIDERDLLITSIAVQYNLVLATNDQNEGMKRIEKTAQKLESDRKPVRLRIEYWPKSI
ncbi:MAG: type II toxin-antitoxin system VapC family toxin [Candidatus Binatia bacterium]